MEITDKIPLEAAVKYLMKERDNLKCKLDLATTEFAVPDGFSPGDKVIVQIRKK